MSRIEVYTINADGVVSPFGESHNASACAPHIWSVFAKKYDVPDPLRSRVLDDAPLWTTLPASGRMSITDLAVLRFTFDASWVSHPNIPRLTAALREFWATHSKITDSFDHKVYDVAPTIPGVADLLDKIHAGVPVRGVCFNQTSVNDNPWRTRTVEGDEDGEGEEWRPFNFDVDQIDANGASPFEVFDGMSSPSEENR